MKGLGPGASPGIVAGRPTPLTTLLVKLERPMLCLSFAWFLVIIAELVNGTTALLSAVGTSLWALLFVHVSLRFANFPDQVLFLKKNWLFVLAMLVPVLRFFPFLQSLPLTRALTATFGLQVLWMFASADQGLRSISRAVGRRGAGYAVTFTAVVVLAGAAGMLHFENGVSGPLGIHSYPKALWWVSMQVTTVGSAYAPKTRGGELLCLGISVFAAAMFGYLTAMIATLIIGREVKEVKKEIPTSSSVAQLTAEVALLRASVEAVLRRVSEPTGDNSYNKK
jgi:voltage-gated potassium channel